MADADVPAGLLDAYPEVSAAFKLRVQNCSDINKRIQDVVKSSQSASAAASPATSGGNAATSLSPSVGAVAPTAPRSAADIQGVYVKTKSHSFPALTKQTRWDSSALQARAQMRTHCIFQIYQRQCGGVQVVSSEFKWRQGNGSEVHLLDRCSRCCSCGRVERVSCSCCSPKIACVTNWTGFLELKYCTQDSRVVSLCCGARTKWSAM